MPLAKVAENKRKLNDMRLGLSVNGSVICRLRGSVRYACVCVWVLFSVAMRCDTVTLLLQQKLVVIKRNVTTTVCVCVFAQCYQPHMRRARPSTTALPRGVPSATHAVPPRQRSASSTAACVTTVPGRKGIRDFRIGPPQSCWLTWCWWWRWGWW
jgi:hypothetical protein